MFEKNLDAQIDAGVHGLIVGGSLGEASTIRQEEKEQLIRKAQRSQLKQFPLYSILQRVQPAMQLNKPGLQKTGEPTD